MPWQKSPLTSNIRTTSRRWGSLAGTVKLSRICPFCGRILLHQRLRINDLAVAAGGENAAKLLNLTVPQKELAELNKRKAELEDSLSKREAELKELRSKKKSLLERQIRRAQVRINAKERKRRTRRLILLGSYLDDIIQNDPVSMKRVSKGLDEFLERDRDRELFDLPPRS